MREIRLYVHEEDRVIREVIQKKKMYHGTKRDLFPYRKENIHVEYSRKKKIKSIAFDKSNKTLSGLKINVRSLKSFTLLVTTDFRI